MISWKAYFYCTHSMALNLNLTFVDMRASKRWNTSVPTLSQNKFILTRHDNELVITFSTNITVFWNVTPCSLLVCISVSEERPVHLRS
jgi:hypothetical protein